MDANLWGSRTPAGARRSEYRGPRPRAPCECRRPAPPSPRLGSSGRTFGRAPSRWGRGGQSRTHRSATAPPLPRAPRAPGYGQRGRARDFRRERRAGVGLPAVAAETEAAEGTSGPGRRSSRDFRRPGREARPELPAAPEVQGVGLPGRWAASGRRFGVLRLPVCRGAAWLGTGRLQRRARLALGVGGHGGGRTGECRAVIFHPRGVPGVHGAMASERDWGRARGAYGCLAPALHPRPRVPWSLLSMEGWGRSGAGGRRLAQSLRLRGGQELKGPVAPSRSSRLPYPARSAEAEPVVGECGDSESFIYFRSSERPVNPGWWPLRCDLRSVPGIVCLRGGLVPPECLLRARPPRSARSARGLGLRRAGAAWPRG